MSSTATPTASGWDTKRCKLFNAVAEVCMVYGMDETSLQALEIKEAGVRIVPTCICKTYRLMRVLLRFELSARGAMDGEW